MQSKLMMTIACAFFLTLTAMPTAAAITEDVPTIDANVGPCATDYGGAALVSAGNTVTAAGNLNVGGVTSGGLGVAGAGLSLVFCTLY